MIDILNTGQRSTILDDSILDVYSETSPFNLVLSVDPTNNRVGINKVPTIDLDISGDTAISSTLTVNGTALVVDALGNIGIGTTPSDAYGIQIVGNTLIAGTLQTFGPLTFISSTTFQTTDPVLILNQGGTDASAAASGISIQRTNASIPAVLTWNNTTNNFKAGLSGSTTSLIRSGGNTDGASVAIGTSDGYALNLKANNATGVTIANSGAISIPNNLTVNGTISINGVPVQSQGLPPGSIVSFFPGYFTNSSNGGFTSTVTTNSISAINSWLSGNGFSQWHVCDGTAQNIAGSQIFNGANRFLPNITDLRFAASANGAGSTGGTNNRDHTHNIPNALASPLGLTHTHTLSPSTIPYSAVSFSIDAFSGSTSSESPSSSQDYTGNAGPWAHTHGAYSHQHGTNSGSNGFYGRIDYYPGTQHIEFQFPIPSSGSYPFTSSEYAFISQVLVAGTPAVPSGTIMDGSSSGALGPAGPGTNLFTSTDLNSTIAFPHHHVDSGHTHTFPHGHPATTPHTHGPGDHTHNVNPTDIPEAQFLHNHTTGSATQTENRPQYLSCVYLMRVR